MDTTEIVAFYQPMKKFCDHFHTTSRNSLYLNFIPSHSNNIHALEQLRANKNKASSSSQFVKKMLASLPFSCQSQSPSPYFDQSLFRFEEKDPLEPVLLFAKPLVPEKLAAAGVVPPSNSTKSGASAPPYRFSGRIGRAGRIVFDRWNPLFHTPIDCVNSFYMAPKPRPSTYN